MNCNASPSMHSHTGFRKFAGILLIAALLAVLVGCPEPTKNSVLPQTSPLMPKTGSTTTDPTPALTWESVSGAIRYHVRIASNLEDLDSAQITSVTGTAYIPAKPLANSQTHYWQVRAIDSSGYNGVWNEAASFKVEWGKITNILPSSGEVLNDAFPEFSWDTIEDAISYELQIGTSGDTMSNAIPRELTASSWIPEKALTDAPVYYWRVRAIRDGNFNGKWSNTAILKISLITDLAPQADAILFSNIPKLSWQPMEGTYRYYVQISEIESGLTEAVEYLADNTEYQSQSLTIDTSYFWRVRTVDLNGLTAGWSQTSTFDIVQGVISNLQPISGSQTNTSPSLQWDAVDGAIHYQLQIVGTASASGGVDVFASANTLKIDLRYDENDLLLPPVYTPESIVEKRYYYWRVQAVDIQGNPGVWSFEHAFYTGLRY